MTKKKPKGKRAAGGDDAEDPKPTGAVTMPTGYRPHLCCAKPAAKGQLSAIHGVTFRRDGEDCIVESTDGTARVRIVLPGQGPQAPRQATVIARAMRLLAHAKADEVQLRFRPGRVVASFDGESHEFPLLPPELPFPEREEKPGPGTVGSTRVDAVRIARVQRALGAEAVFISVRDDGSIFVEPEPHDGTSNSGSIGQWSPKAKEDPDAVAAEDA